MKIITQISFAPSQTGIRLSYATTEIDDAGMIISTGEIGSHTADDTEAELVRSLMAAVKARPDKQDKQDKEEQA